MKKILVISFLLLIGLVLLTEATPCRGQDKFPAKPITLFIGFGPGGTGDITNRALAEAASKILGQPIVVLNKPGAGGAVALGELKNAQPDGYTIGSLSSAGIISAAMRKVNYHPVNDFDAILQTNSIVYGLVVRTDSPFQSLKDLLAYAQANPNKIKYSTTGPGSPVHLTMVRLADLLDIKWTHVPFGGGVEAVSALLGGHVDYTSSTAEWKPYVLSGRLRLLVTFGSRRIAAYPDAPTLIELGYNMTAPNTACIAGPKGIPQDRLKILHDALYKAMDAPEFRTSLEKFDLPLDYKNSHDAEIIIKEIYETTGKLIGKIEKQ